jgi:hypothetical protein
MSWTIKSADEPQGATEILVAQISRLNGQGFEITTPDRIGDSLRELSEPIILGGITIDVLDFLSTKGVIKLTDEEAASKAIASFKSGG